MKVESAEGDMDMQCPGCGAEMGTECLDEFCELREDDE